VFRGKDVRQIESPAPFTKTSVNRSQNWGCARAARLAPGELRPALRHLPETARIIFVCPGARAVSQQPQRNAFVLAGCALPQPGLLVSLPTGVTPYHHE